MRTNGVIRRFRDWWGSRLRRRLLASSVVSTLFFLVLQSVLLLRTGQASVAHEVTQANRRMASLVAKDIDAQHDNALRSARLFGRHLEAPGDSLSLRARKMLELRQAAPLDYRALYLLDHDGHLLIHLADSLEELEANRDVENIINRPPIPLGEDISAAYEAAKREGLFLSPARLVGADQVPVIYMSMLLETDGEVQSRVLVIAIDLRSIWRRIDEVYVGGTGQAFVVSRDGTIIAHPDRAYIGQPLAQELRPVLDGYEGQTEYTCPIGGRAMLASYSPVGKQSGWGVVVEQEQSEALAPVNRMVLFTLSVLIAAVGITTILAVLIARSVTRPIQRLEEASRTIALTGDLGRNVTVEGKDEVGQLAATFNLMTANLQRARQEIRSMNEELEGRVAERTAQLEAANRQLRDLVYAASHDMKTPLRGIIQLAQWLSDDYADALDQEGREMVRLLIRRTKRMNGLVDGVFQYSRVGFVAEQERRVDLDQLLAEAIATLSPPENVRITVDHELPTVVGRRTHLMQVLQNLLDNAIKFIDKPQGLVSVGCVDEGTSWRFSVADNGPGIEERHYDKAFQIFQTLVPRDEFESTGVGLALVKKIVEMWGGCVWLESTVGQGSTFFFTLPKKGENNEDQETHSAGR